MCESVSHSRIGAMNLIADSDQKDLNVRFGMTWGNRRKRYSPPRLSSSRSLINVAEFYPQQPKSVNPTSYKRKLRIYNEAARRRFARIKMDAYDRQVEKSDGFDVKDRPGPPGFGQIRPLNLSKEGNMAECKKFAGYAINAYNEKYKGKNKVIELEEVVKAMFQGAGGVIFYLTFVAKNPVKNKRKTYQAIVYGPRWNFEVEAFRTKPKDDVRGSATSPKKWKWDNRPRCCGGSKGNKRARI